MRKGNSLVFLICNLIFYEYLKIWRLITGLLCGKEIFKSNFQIRVNGMKRTHWFYNFSHHYSSSERIAIRWLSVNMKLFPLGMNSKLINWQTDRQTDAAKANHGKSTANRKCMCMELSSPAHTWPLKRHHLFLRLYTPCPSHPLPVHTAARGELPESKLQNVVLCSVCPEPSEDSSPLAQIITVNCSPDPSVGAQRGHPPTLLWPPAAAPASHPERQVRICSCSFWSSPAVPLLSGSLCSGYSF